MSLLRALNSASAASSLNAWVMRVKTVNMTSMRTLIRSSMSRCGPAGQSDDKIDPNVLRMMRDLLSKMDKLQHSMDTTLLTRADLGISKTHDDATSCKGDLRSTDHSHGHRGGHNHMDGTLGQQKLTPDKK